ncbi:hypothetical protein DYB32_009516 [Aphanomyces invadans]|uniref:FAD dependent oxidoreductase domain-containing protein n=1 Tax=Aphanomyces invadans TaxID=157072 RepID=A0A3R7CTY5_9STRA|nr:hypothetical protein DYB32_009516 [Aphanomyces invadans]
MDKIRMGLAADVAVIGGGVVGAAVFRELVLHGYKVILLEKDANVVHGASSGNSGIACTGYDAPIGSIETDAAPSSSSRATTVRARVVVNCAGLYSDIVEQIHTPAVPFHVRPLYGHVVVGPTAEDQDARDDFSTTPETLDMLRAAAAKVVPALASCAMVGSYAGLRPATEHRDYQIEMDEARQWVTVGGIRSTGVTASLGIADYVASLIDASDLGHVHRDTARCPTPFSLPPDLECQGTSDTMTVTLDGVVHKVSHPLSRWGLSKRSQTMTRAL